jgi:hypothetical protein
MFLSVYGLDLQFASNQSLFEDSTTIEIIFTNPNTCYTTVWIDHQRYCAITTTVLMGRSQTLGKWIFCTVALQTPVDVR